MVVADDQELVRSGLQLVLEARGCEVVGVAGDGREAVAVVRATEPDVVLMDIRMPVLDGIAATRELTAAGSPSQVLVLTTYDLDRYVYDALAAGAAGFLLKATPPDRLVEGIRTVCAGESLLSPVLTRRLIESYLRHPPADGAADARGRPDRARAAGAGARGARALQRRDRRRAGRRRVDGEDPRQPDPGQARRDHPGAGGRARLGARAGPRASWR